MTNIASLQLHPFPLSSHLHPTFSDNLFHLWDLGPGTWRILTSLFATLTEYSQAFSSLAVTVGHWSGYTVWRQPLTVTLALLKECSGQRGDPAGLLSIPWNLRREIQHRWPSLWNHRWLSRFFQVDETEKLRIKALSSSSKNLFQTIQHPFTGYIVD